MHSTRIKYTENGREHEAVIHHNGDWSGDAIIKWNLRPHANFPNIMIADREVILPGRILQALVLLETECAIEELEGVIRRLGGKVPK
jgi:hypothetical protein